VTPSQEHHSRCSLAKLLKLDRPVGKDGLETILTSADTALRDARHAIWDMRAVELEGRDLAEALEGAVRSVITGASTAL
jgi:signal transduction histidine kinase